MPDRDQAARDDELRNIDGEIRRLVQDADDPRDKATLLILQQINASLAANTAATARIAAASRETAQTLGAYAQNFDAWRNRGFGAWKVIGISVLVLQALGGIIVTTYIGHVTDNEHDLRAVQLEAITLKARVTGVESQQLWMMNQIMTNSAARFAPAK